MKHTLLGISVSVFVLGSGPRVFADLTVIDEFDPSMATTLCGVAFDHATGNVWVYNCFSADVQSYSSGGIFLSSVTRPGDSANDVDIDIAPEALTLGVTTIPAATLLFINGEVGVAEIYAVDTDTGMVLASLTTEFGASHVVGGVYHPQRDTFFLVQDNVGGAKNGNRVAEVDPITGAVLSTFQFTDTFSVNFGDIEVSTGTGNLYLVSSSESSIAEFTTEGTFVQSLDLPAGVSSLSGIGIDDAAGEAWVAGTGGIVWRLGGLEPMTCPWDCGGDNDDAVGIVDFLALLAQWGGPGSCDFDGGGVGIVDFLKLLANWGPCP